MQLESRRKSQTVKNAAPQRAAHVSPNRSKSADLSPQTPRPTGRHGRPPRPNAIILGSPDIRTNKSHRSTCLISMAGATERIIHSAVLDIIVHNILCTPSTGRRY